MISAPTKSFASAKRDSAATALLAAVLIAAGLTGVATMSAAGSGALQELLRFAGVGRTTLLEQEQQRHTAAIAEIKRALANVAGDIGTVAVQARLAQTDAAGTIGLLAKLDGDVGALRETVARQSKPGETPPGAMPQSDRLVHGALMELASLRSTVDANESSQRKDIAVINHRLERLERTLTGHEITGSLQAKPPRKQVRRQAPASRGDLAMNASPLRDAAQLGVPGRALEERQAGAW